jgi:aminomethyltransferase
LDEDTTPVEAGLLWSIAKDKKENYIGRNVIMGQISGETAKTKKLIAFEMEDKAIPRHGYEIYFEDKKTGIVTSGGISPTLGKYIGLGYVDLSNTPLTFLNKTPFPIGTEVHVMVRNRLYNAKVVKRPFVEKHVVAQDRSK